MYRTGPWKSDRSFRLIGADADAVPNGTDRALIPNQLRVVGVWQDDAITVEEQEPVRWLARPAPEPLFAGAVPTGGWDRVEQSTEVEGLQALRDAGQIVRDEWLRTDDGALVLRVAATDVDAVKTVLAPQLPRRLHVVQSRVHAAQLHEVEQMFATHCDEWGFEAWSCSDLDAQGQPYAEAVLARVSAGLATWADTLPDDLLTLSPAMTPA